MEWQEILTNPHINLRKVEYTALPVDIEVDEMTVQVNDKFDSKFSKVDDKFITEFSRHIVFTPSQLFEIHIEYFVTWDYDLENKKVLEEKIDKIDENDINLLSSQVISEAVFTIAQLTRTAFMPPLITPCEFLFENNNDNK